MTSVIRRTAVVGTAFALASASLLGTATARTHPPKPPATKTTTLTIHAPSTVSASSHFKATVTGKLRYRKMGLANEMVALQDRSGKGKAWTNSGQTATTDASGKVSFTFAQQAKREQYRLAFAGNSTYRASKSGTVTITRTR